MKKYRISKVWIIVGVLVVLAVAAWLATRSKDETKISFTTAKVEPGQHSEQRDCHRHNRAGDERNRWYSGVRYSKSSVCRL